MTANVIFRTFSVATKQWSKTDKSEILFLLRLNNYLYIKGFFL